jgi:NAD-dependent DNA ligase
VALSAIACRLMMTGGTRTIYPLTGGCAMKDGVLARIQISDAPMKVVEVEPSGQTLRLTLLQDGKRKRIQAHALTGAIDADTGEVLEHPVKYFRAIWARRVCGQTKQWPLVDLINGLTVKGLGPQYAQRIAAAMGTWDRFVQALGQLQNVELPSSRDDIHYLQFETAMNQGLVNTTMTDHHIKLGAADVVLRSKVSEMPVGVSLPPAYPEPLATLMNEVGPVMWKSLREWADSPDSRDEVHELLQFGAPAEYQPRASHGAMTGMIFVFTGTLQSMTREEACRAVEGAGGIVEGSVSEQTSVVVTGTGSERGTKLRQATKFGVDLWNEEEFLAAIGGNRGAP